MTTPSQQAQELAENAITAMLQCDPSISIEEIEQSKIKQPERWAATVMRVIEELNLESLVKDKERLDWLNDNHYDGGSEIDPAYLISFGSEIDSRKAIDAAMKGEQ